jgi:excisionase family DNA binding protein
MLIIYCQGTGGTMTTLEQVAQEEALLTFKEAMGFLRVSRSTLYRLMWSGQLRGHKVGSTWRFYKQDLRSVVSSTPVEASSHTLSASFATLRSTQNTSREEHR